MAKIVHLALSSLVCLLLCVSSAWGEGEKNPRKEILKASSVEELQGIYKGSENAMIRRDAVQALSRVHAPKRERLGKRAAAAAGPEAEEKVLLLLDQGLQDPNVSVVKETIRQIGKLKRDEYRETLFELFYGAGDRFPGNQKEIRMEIIGALGEIDGREAEILFREILAQGVANSMTAKVLTILRATGDASMADAVAAHGDSLEGILQAIPDTPENRPRYNKYRQALAFARSVEKTLAER